MPESLECGKGKWESYDGQTELLVLDAGYQMDNMSIGAEKNLLATYTRDGMIHVFDLEKEQKPRHSSVEIIKRSR